MNTTRILLLMLGIGTVVMYFCKCEGMSDIHYLFGITWIWMSILIERK